MGLHNSKGLFDGLICKGGGLYKGGLMHGVIIRLASSI